VFPPKVGDTSHPNPTQALALTIFLAAAGRGIDNQQEFIAAFGGLHSLLLIGCRLYFKRHDTRTDVTMTFSPLTMRVITYE